MRLKRRVGAYITIVMCALSVLLLVVAGTTLLVNAVRTDEQRALDESIRAMRALDGRLEALAGNAADWSVWDDTYAFVSGTNPDYVRVNLAGETFGNLGADMIGVYGENGAPLAVLAEGPAGTPTATDSDRDLLHTHPELKEKSGIVRRPDGRLMIVGTGRITTSDSSAAPVGTLVMASVLDGREVARIASQTQLELALGPRPHTPSAIPVAETGAKSVVVTQPIRDESGVPVATLLVSRPRLAWTAALGSLYSTGVVIFGLVMLTMLALGSGVQRLVLRRLADLHERVNRIRETGMPEYIALDGDDELSSLAESVTAMATELDEARSIVEHARQLSEHRYDALLDNLTDVVFTMNSEGELGFVSSASECMFGLKPEELRGKTLDTILGWSGAEHVMRRAGRGLSEQGAHLTIEGCGSAEGPLDLEVILTSFGEDGEIQGIVRDITARRQHECELLHMASHDFLTGLWNRRRFEDELGRALSEVARGGDAGAVLWLDLDGFKDVNDTLGHHAGDQLLCKVAQTLSGSVRADSVVARLGGDEFAVMIRKASEADALAAGERLVDAISAIRVDFDGRCVRASTSLGVVLYPQHGTDVETLLARADMAMYHAKELGRARTMLFDPSQEWRDGIEDRQVWTELVESALREGDFIAHAQPIVDVSTGDVVSYELLTRMRGLEDVVVLPDRFLPVAERTGLVVDIDIWILGEAVRILEEHPDETFRLNVNASPRTLSDPRYLNALTALVPASPIDPSRLTIEITETAIIVDIASVGDTLRRIKALGCRIALDDFGSGFTSFLHLKQLPVDDIKIDGSFVRNLEDNTNDQHLIRAMVEMAKGLDMQTTAESVETDESLSLLRSFGVEMVQGYLVGIPASSCDAFTVGETASRRNAPSGAAGPTR